MRACHDFPPVRNMLQWCRDTHHPYNVREDFSLTTHPYPTIGRAVMITAACLLAAGQAMATCPAPLDCTATIYRDVTTAPTLSVASEASQNAQGLWDYRYTFSSDVTPPAAAPFILSSLSIPYFSDANITQLRLGSPFSNYQRVGTTSASDGSQAIQATTQLPPPPDLPSVFSVIEFTSTYAPTAEGTARVLLANNSYSTTSYQSGAAVTFVTRGLASISPALLSVRLPGSPLALAAAVPEPGTMAFMLVGLACLGTVVAAKRRPA
jgi:hypothetical protein